MIEAIVGAVVGLAVGGAVAYALSLRAKRAAETRAAGAEAKVGELRTQIARAEEDFRDLRKGLDAEREARVKAQTELAEATKNVQDQKKLLEQAQARLTDTFKALSDDALKSNNQAFLELAKKTLEGALAEAKGDLDKRKEAIDGLVKPLGESLKQYEDHIRALEQTRQKAYVSLEEQLKLLSTTHQELRKQTGSLVNALKTPQVRGQWGELGLRRVVELAGMSPHCDFTEQVSLQAEGGRLRPDMIVHLPGGREIVVDAKVSLDAYLRALSAESDEERAHCLREHARQTRDHMEALAKKSYWDDLKGTPEFVVMFIRSESFFGAAVDQDPALIEDGMRNRVVLATPTTLIALLRAVAYGWRQEQLAQNARTISNLGRELYDRLRTLAGHISDMGRGLERANQAYNQAVGSMEHRVFPAARRFKELGVTAGKDIPTVEPVDTSLRKLTPPDDDDAPE